MNKHKKTELTNICAQTMIVKVMKAEQLPICLDIIHTGTKTFDHLPFTVGFMELKF